MVILVTGGLGFIGSNFVRYYQAHYPEDELIVLDAMTYAANSKNLEGINVKIVEGDITNEEHVHEVVRSGLDVIINFAACSHVDRSLHDANEFVRTNVYGTQVLLDAAKNAGVKRFLQISTDEVFGDLGAGAKPALEEDVLRPTSLYAASKAASDLIALSYYKTHGVDVIVTRATNNYGPYQYPEKLIPCMILRALQGKKLPLYGDGLQIREWLHVEDHCVMLNHVMRHGHAGEIYNIGGGRELTNYTVVRRIIDYVGRGEIEHVEDRPGHDRRYAVNSEKMAKLGLLQQRVFVEGLKKTIDWYREHESWWKPILEGSHHQAWMEKNYEKRGVAKLFEGK